MALDWWWQWWWYQAWWAIHRVSACWKLLSANAINFLKTLLARTKLKYGLFSRIVSSVQNCQNLCTNCLKIEWSRNVLFAASWGWCRKREAEFAALREYVTSQGLRGLKFAVVCYFQGRYLIPQTYLITWCPLSNWWANMSILIQITTALCNNFEHLHLIR